MTIQPFKIFPVRSFLLAVLASCVTLSNAIAATCSSRDLAPGYCDANGDLVADTPEDKAQWLNPNPLVIGDVPTSDMATRADRAQPFILHLEKATGRKVTYFVAKDYADLLSAYKANRVHVVNINTGNVEKEVRCQGYVPIAQPIDAKGQMAGAQMILLVPTNSSLKSPRDLKGHKVTFVDEGSNSGYKAPRAILKKEFGLEAGKDYSYDFSGRHDNSILGVANGAYEAAASATDIYEKLLRDKLLDPLSVKFLFVSQTFPQSPWGVNHRLDPALVSSVREAFINYKGPKDAHSNSGRYRAANYKSDWAFIRELSLAAGNVPVCQ